jgi:hypothetical protein
MGHYVVEVEASTHELLKAGVLAMRRGLTGSRYRGLALNEPAMAPSSLLSGPDFTTVYVSALEAHSDDEAVLVACQMAACTSGGMPTMARLVSWPTEEDQ